MNFFVKLLYFSSLVLGSHVPEQAVLATATKDDASTGCGLPLPPGVTPGNLATKMYINSYGQDRYYWLHVPLGYKINITTAMYFSFHGADRNATEQELLSSFSDPYFNNDSIAVYPQGINNHWLSNPDVKPYFPNDLDFVNLLINTLNSTLCINSSAIYAAGKSNGGGFTNTIACNRTVGSRFAAFASVSGAYYNQTFVPGIGPCNNPGKTYTPFLEMHGVQDCTVPYDGKQNPILNKTEPYIPVFMQQWAQNNGCPPEAPYSNSQTMNGPNNQSTRIESWNCGGRNGIVQHYRMEEIGHIWPSTLQNDDCTRIWRQCYGGHYFFNATTSIIAFFKSYTLKDRDD